LRQQKKENRVSFDACVNKTRRKSANQRPSSVWAYLMKQITSSYMQVPEDLQVKFTSAFKCSYKCSVCLTVILTVKFYLDSSF
jgi:hypothetical protein